MLEIIKEWLKAKFHVHDWETVEEHVTRVFQDDYQKRPIKTKKYTYNVVKYVMVYENFVLIFKY